jgi:lipopolysaccharide transport system permease protein
VATFRNLTALFRYRGLIQTLVVRDLKARYRGSVLGFFWSFFNPLMLLMIYTFVFTKVMPGSHPPDMEPYALFMFVVRLIAARVVQYADRRRQFD